MFITIQSFKLIHVNYHNACSYDRLLFLSLSLFLVYALQAIKIHYPVDSRHYHFFIYLLYHSCEQ